MSSPIFSLHDPDCRAVRNPDDLCRCDLTGKSKVGDWIWRQLAAGRSDKEITDELAHYVDELNRRHISGA